MREQDLNLEQLDTIVLLDIRAQYSGTVAVARLLLAAKEQRMVDLKTEPLLSVSPDTDEKEVFELFDKYNLLMLPVVDDQKMLVGVVTADDVIGFLRSKL